MQTDNETNRNLSARTTVIHLCSWFPNKHDPLHGVFIRNHINLLKNDFNNNIIAVIEVKNQSQKIIIEEYSKGGINHLIIYFRTSGLKFVNLLKKVWLYFYGFRALKKNLHQIDLLHAHVFFHAGIVAWLLKIYFRIPLIVSAHSTVFYNKRQKTGFSFLVRKILGASDMVLPVSSSLLRAIQKTTNAKFNYRIIANVVNTDLFRPGAKQAGIKTILHVSNLNDSQKNISGMLRVVKRLSLIRNDFKLHLVGARNNRGQIDTLVEKYKIGKEFISVRGILSDSELATEFSMASCFLLFSNSETFSIVLAEAWSAGLPAVYSKCGGLTEITKSDLGIQLKPKDEEHLHESLNFMLSNLDNYDSNKIRSIALEMFDNNKLRKEMKDIYRDLIHR